MLQKVVGELMQQSTTAQQAVIRDIVEEARKQAIKRWGPYYERVDYQNGYVEGAKQTHALLTSPERSVPYSTAALQWS